MNASARVVSIDYLKPGSTGAQAMATLPPMPSPRERIELIERIKHALIQQQAVLVAHYYVDPDLQDLALETGGCVADSLEMARFGRDSPAQTLVVCGVRFMGETAKILSPGKRVLMPTLEATCSLDLGCPADEFGAFCDAHPDRTVVVYANTSAAVKARADWMVTSSIALRIVSHLHAAGEKILWAPDRHLGDYIARQTGADMLCWQGACVVHDEFRATELAALKTQHPQALVLAHPESPAGVLALADVVGSTSQMIEATQRLPATLFIVATDNGLLHQMRRQAPGKVFIEAPTAGNGATCKSCAHCPWMAMNSLESLALTLEEGRNEIWVDPELGMAAHRCVDRMLNFARSHGAPSVSTGDLTRDAGTHHQGLGPA